MTTQMERRLVTSGAIVASGRSHVELEAYSEEAETFDARHDKHHPRGWTERGKPSDPGSSIDLALRQVRMAVQRCR